jgi:hypothetical protein
MRKNALLSWPLGLLAAVLINGNCPAQDTVKTNGPAKVEVRHESGRWQLYINHKPFYIKGAGVEFGNQDKLPEHGGNSFRTWTVENGKESGQHVLDRAWKNGLYVTMGLDVKLERHGFNYDDTNAVAQQLAGLKAQVLKFKDHPALLMWDIGNELNLQGQNPRVWDAVNDISKMIHQVDPNHLTLTSIAGSEKQVVKEIEKRAPDLDLIAFQAYAKIVDLPNNLCESGWEKPYVLTEWGATGYRDVKKTDWGAGIEENSSVKAASYLRRYQTVIALDTNQCLGSYVFLWGQKQERTPTWYGMFLETGEETETVDVMEYIWTGHWPKIRCPHLNDFLLDGKTADQNVHLKIGQTYTAKVLATSTLPLTYSWEIMEESAAKTRGGDFEPRPRSFPSLVIPGKNGEAQLIAPSTPGAYRLFACVYDGKGHAAHANIPFYVDPSKGDSPPTTVQ